jgi:hypothetical protein
MEEKATKTKNKATEISRGSTDLEVDKKDHCCQACRRGMDE